MRILLGVHAFPPCSTAGVEVYTLRLARALQALGHEVLVLSAVHDLAAEPYALRRRRHEGVDVAEVVNVHHQGTLEATYLDEGVDRAARTVLEEFSPQVVHLQHLLNLSAGIVAEGRRSGARVVLTLHDYWLSCPRDGLRMRADLGLCASMDHGVCAGCLRDSPYLVPPLQRRLGAAARRAGLGAQLHRLHAAAPRAVERTLLWLRRGAGEGPQRLAEAMDRRALRLRAALEGVDSFLAPTEFVRARAIEFGIPPDRIHHWPLGAVPGPARPRRAGPRRRLGFVGTVSPHKGVHVLVQAFGGLDDPGLTLDVHGSLTVHPSYAEDLRRRSSSDPRIRFHGAFAEGEQPRILAALDLLVLPSLWWENSPLSVLEALAAGLPVVASDTGGVPELIAGTGWGLLVPPGDVAALREALAAVAEGRCLSETSAPFSLKTVAQGAGELQELYLALSRWRDARPWHGEVRVLTSVLKAMPPPARPLPRVTVALLVKDGAAHLRTLLPALEAQKVPGGLEVLALDSGPAHGSDALLERHGARVLRVPPAEFDHGQTRNRAAREARGATVVFLSQDALPADNRFVTRLVEPLEADPRIAGAFARQVPRPEADPLTKRDLAAWVASGLEARTVYLPPQDTAALEPLERYRLSAFDDVASAIRRDLLLAHPFEPTRFGEDAEWGQRMLRLGYGLAYVPEAVVIHSHPRSARGLFRRNYLGHRLLYRLFGLRTVPDRPHLLRAGLGAVVSDFVTLAREGARPAAWLAAPLQALAATYGQYRGARDEASGRPYPEWA